MNDNEPTQSRPQALRKLMSDFIAERLKKKLDALKTDDVEKRSAEEDAHRFDVWVEKAAQRAKQIHFASHIVKPTHPDARGSNITADPNCAPGDKQGLVGTHAVNVNRELDVVGNAAALDVAGFLGLNDGKDSILDLALARDPDLKAAFSENGLKANAWIEGFLAMCQTKEVFESHSLAKQVYFPVGGSRYHLLSPLFPTSLVHASYLQIRNDRFGDDAKAARDARKKGTPSNLGYREYINLGLQKFGGTKPQNISQLNSKRHGENWLLPSLPPEWHSSAVRAPYNCDSVFDGPFSRRKEIKKLTRTLREFLHSTHHNNMAIRQRRADLVAEIIDGLQQFTGELEDTLPPGWSMDSRCTLAEVECFWLDPGRVLSDEAFSLKRSRTDWISGVCARFANWLNRELSLGDLTLGQDEHFQWASDLESELRMFGDHLETTYE